jgi:hypothetical protein
MRMGSVIFVMLVVMVVAAMPIWLAIMSFFGIVVPWVFFGFIGWAAYTALRGPRRSRWHRHYWPPPAMPLPQERTQSFSQPPPPPVMPAPAPERAAALPIDVQVKVEQIRRKVDVLLGFSERFPPFSKDLYIVRQTAGDYLPRTIEAYLALPTGTGERFVTANGKTPLQELKEQLDLLDRKLNEIAEDLQQHDLDRLLANRRFLEERFGRPVEVGPGGIEPPTNRL